MSVMTLWTAARQALLSMAASKQGYWGGLPNDAHTRGFSSVFGVFWFQEAVIQKKGAGERREPRAEAGKRSGSPGSCLSRPGWRHPGPLTLSLRGPIRRARVTLSSPHPTPHTQTLLAEPHVHQTPAAWEKRSHKTAGRSRDPEHDPASWLQLVSTDSFHYLTLRLINVSCFLCLK